MANEKTKKQTKNVPEKKEKPERGKNKAAEREGDGIWAFLIPALLIALAVFIAVCLVAQGFAGGFADNGEIPEKLNGGLNNYAGQANSYPLGVFGYGIMWFFSAFFGSSVYFFPLWLVWFALRFNAIRKREQGIGRFILAICTMIVFSAFIQVVTLSSTDDPGLCIRWSGEYLNHGGWIGMFLAYILCFALKKIGTYLIGIPALIVMLMLIVGIRPSAVAAWIRDKAAENKANGGKKEKRHDKSKADAVAPVAKVTDSADAKPEKDNKQDFEDDNWDEPALSYGDEDKDEPVQPSPSKKSKEAVFIDPDEFFDPIAGLTGQGEPSHAYDKDEDAFTRPEERKSEPEPEPKKASEPEPAPQPKKEEPFIDESKETDWFTYNDEAAADRIFETDQAINDGYYSEQEEKEFDEQFGAGQDTGAQDDFIEADTLFDEPEKEEEEEKEPEPKQEKKPAAPTPPPPKPAPKPVIKPYVFPPADLLNIAPKSATGGFEETERNKQIIRETLHDFRIEIDGPVLVTRGPTVTRYEFKPAPGVRVQSILNLQDDLALALSAPTIRLEAPVPGKSAIGIEVANKAKDTVYLRSLIESPEFTGHKSILAACLGESIEGNSIVFDISKMPHLLIAGATGMGKSVCINSVIVSLLYRAKPEEVRLILIDPKQVEFISYADCPLLAVPIITDMQQAAGALHAANLEMDRRFTEMGRCGVRDIASYNNIIKGDPEKTPMPRYVIIIDELADLMMTAGKDVERSICRLAQKARACGIHLILGTQRPSVDVITGLMKANIPSRIACTVASQVDSRTILDMVGAEKLSGRGDMLYAPVGASKPLRVQGSYVDEKEVESVVRFLITNNGKAEYDDELMNSIQIATDSLSKSKNTSEEEESDEGAGDDKMLAALQVALDFGKISTSLMQRKLKVGYGRAAKIIDRLEELGYVSGAEGKQPRQVLITPEQFAEIKEKGELSED